MQTTTKTDSVPFSVVLQQEARLLMREPAFHLVLGLLTLFMLVAALNGRAESERQHQSFQALAAQQAESIAERRAAAEEEEQQIAAGEEASTSPWGPRSAWGLGRYQGARLAIEPAPLVGLAVGQSDLAPATYHVTTGAAAAQAPEGRPASPFRLLVGGLDAAFVVLYLLPLLLLVVTFDLLAADRERGTLRLLMAGPLRLPALAGARALVRGGLVLAAAVILLTLAFALTGEGAARFVLFILATVLYGAFWIALAVAVNARGWPSATNAAVLAGAWLVLVVVVPALVHTAAGALYPPPSRAAYVAAQRTANAEGLRESRQAMARFLDNHPDLAAAPVGDEPSYPMAAAARDQAVADALAPIEAADRERRERRAAFTGVLRFLSPTLLTHDALLEAAGTGRGRQRHVEAQVAAFRARWTEHFLGRYFTNNVFRAVDYAAIPQFAFTEEPASEVLRRSAGPLAALFLAVLLLAGAGVRLSDRYPVAE
jgi:ABC-2 type transport system permease protein